MNATLNTTTGPIDCVLVETFSPNAQQVDAERGIVRGVKVVGFISKNNRYYKPSTLRAAAPLYESAKVYFDHAEPEQTKLGRKFTDKFGVLRNVHFVENAGLFADLHFNPMHNLAKTFVWEALNDAESLGLSHHATTITARNRDSAGRVVIEQIVKVKSVDIVTDPATTRSLFESETMNDSMPTGEGADPVQMMLNAMATKMKEIAESEGDGETKMQSLASMIGKQDKLMSMLPTKQAASESAAASTAGASGATVAASESVNQGSDNAEIVQLKESVAKLTTALESRNEADRKASLKTVVESELAAAGLKANDPKHVSGLFAAQLLATESVDVRSALISERVALLGVPKPSALPTKPTSSAAPATVLESAKPTDAKSFVAGLR